MFSDMALDRMAYAMGSIIILSWLLSAYGRGGLWQKTRMFLGWAAFLLVLIGLYSFRGELGGVKDRLVAAVIPQKGFEAEPGTMSFYRSANGHFHIEALVNGRKVRFLADTGASDIVIAPHLARSLGFNVSPSDFTKVYHTANGMGRGAPVDISTFEVGGLKMENLPASINQAPMKTSLLGMRFFNRLLGYQVKGEVLTIIW